MYNKEQQSPYEPPSRLTVCVKYLRLTEDKSIRKYQDGRKVWMQNEQKVWAYCMEVIEAQYIEAENAWYYYLKDETGKAHSAWVPERKLKLP